MKIASSATKTGLEKLINEFYYSTSIRILDNGEVHNINGHLVSIEVINRNGRYVCQTIEGKPKTLDESLQIIKNMINKH